MPKEARPIIIHNTPSLTILIEKGLDGRNFFPRLSENPILMNSFYRAFPHPHVLKKYEREYTGNVPFYERENENDLTAFDSISVFWLNVDGFISLTQNLGQIDRLNLPRREKNGLIRQHKKMVEAMNKSILGIDLFIKSRKPHWDKAIEIAKSVNIVRKSEALNRQMIVLAEELNKTRGQDLISIRRKIAQSAWTELINKIPYAKATERRLTTVNDSDTERLQIREAIDGGFWDLKAKKKAKKEFNERVEFMETQGYPKELVKKFESLFATAMGQDSGESTVSILILEEAILEGLYDQNAFGNKREESVYDVIIMEDLSMDPRL